MKTIGTFKDERGRDRAFRIDPQKLLVSRMLITANSGHGKSALIRVILESLGKAAPIIVLDKDGDYITLGEKLDVVQVGPLGDLAADVRSAGMLCRRLMEKRLSAVIDLSDLKLGRTSRNDKRNEPGQRDYIDAFLTELLELPRKLWRPTFIALDEAHLYAPESGHGDAISTGAVINLSTQGRKRGLCPIYATLRIASLAKDAAAEQMNRVLGGVTQDNDIKRCALDLGMSGSEARKTLRSMPMREFYGYGPAFEQRGITKFVAAKPITTHPEAGQGRTLKPPKPSSAIKAVMKDFADLPEEVEKEIKDLAVAKSQIAQLEREIKTRPKEQIVQQKTVEVSSKRDQQIIARLRAGLEAAMKVIAQINAQGFDKTKIDRKEILAAMEAASDRIAKLVEQRLSTRNVEFEKFKKEASSLLGRLQKLMENDVNVTLDVRHNEPFTISHSNPTKHHADTGDLKTVDVEPGVPKPKSGAKKIAIALAQWNPRRLDRETLRFYSGFATGSGTFTEYLGSMRKNGMLDETPAGIRATKGTFDWLSELGERVPDVPTTPGEYLENAMKMPFVKAGAKKIGQYLIDHHEHVIAREDLRTACGFEEGSGTFTEYLGAMRKAGIAVDVTGGVQANPAMYDV